VVEQPGAGLVAISDAGRANYPRTYLTRSGGTVLITHLARRPEDPNVAFEAATPVTLPWRVVIVGFNRESLGQSTILRDLNR